jgi:hypothetical protein
VTAPTTYPRLPDEYARVLFQEQAEQSVEELIARAATTHPNEEWHPTAPVRATTQTLQQLRSEVIETAARHGYPDLQRRGGHTHFDQQLAAQLYTQLGIVPAEAAFGGMWSFLALVLLPDVAAWRYERRHPDRFIGADLMLGSSNRHVFGRLWARVHILGADVSSGLGEDNVVNLFERTTFGGYPRLARAIGETHIRAAANNRTISGQDLMRDAMRRLRRLAMIVSFVALDDDQLTALIEDVFSTSAAALPAGSARSTGAEL